MTRRLFLLDARHEVERRLLLDWLPSSGLATSEIAPGDWLVLPEHGSSHERDLDRLMARLDQGDDTLELLPLRVSWRLPHFAREHGLRLRDILLGDPRSPGQLRARILLARDPDRARCLAGAAATLGDLRRRLAREVDGGTTASDPRALANFVLRQAALALDVEERSVQGARYKTPRFVAESVEHQPGFDREIRQLADASGAQAATVHRRADALLRQLVSTPSALFLDLRNSLDRRLWLRGYDADIRHDPAEFERLRATMRAHPTVLVFTHKTYGDAALPGLMLYENDLPMLHTFGGSNLDFPGFGYLMRRSGGIFIRRTFRDDPLYALLVRRYVAFLLGKRFPLSWALEGTRSRQGKLMPPRFGLLRYALDAMREHDVGDLHVIPFVTSFELIRDVDEYVAEQQGRAKQPESLRWLMQYARGDGRPLGRVRVDLGNAVVVRNAPGPGDRHGLERIAYDVGLEANRVTPLTVTGVMCLLLLGMAPRGATAAELTTFVAYLGEWARLRNVRLSDELAAGDRSHFFERISALVDAGLLVRYDEGQDAIYAIEPSRQAAASYYRNTIGHHFLDKTMLELALLRLQDEPARDPETTLWAATERFRDLFKTEFYFPPRDRHREQLATELDRVEPAWREQLATGSTGVSLLMHRLQPHLGHSVLLPYVEAYSIVFSMLARLPLGEQPDHGRTLALAMEQGRRAWLLRRISSEVSVSRILFENGWRLATRLGLTVAGTPGVVERRQAMLKEFRTLARHMERLRVEGLEFAEKVMARQVTL